METSSRILSGDGGGDRISGQERREIQGWEVQAR